MLEADIAKKDTTITGHEQTLTHRDSKISDLEKQLLSLTEVISTKNNDNGQLKELMANEVANLQNEIKAMNDKISLNKLTLSEE